MSATFFFVLPVCRANKEVLTLFKVARRAVIQLLFAVRAVDNAGEQTRFSRRCSSVTLLTKLLHFFKDFRLNNDRVRVVKYYLIF